MMSDTVGVQENQILTDSTTVEHLFNNLQVCTELLLVLGDCHVVGALGVTSKEGHGLVETADLAFNQDVISKVIADQDSFSVSRSFPLNRSNSPVLMDLSVKILKIRFLLRITFIFP